MANIGILMRCLARLLQPFRPATIGFWTRRQSECTEACSPARIRFADEVQPMRRQSLEPLLSGDPAEANRFSGYRRSVKEFYRIESPDGPLFVKVRRFPSRLKQLLNTVRQTKDEREFEQIVALRRAGIPCPAPLAVARLGGWLRERETRLAMEFVTDAAPLKQVLIGGEAAERAATMERLIEFLRLLNAKGVVHGDLHWNNLLVRRTPQGSEFLLVDALHVRLVDPPAGDEFAPTVQWLLAYMLHQDAPREIVEDMLDHVRRLDLPALSDAPALLGQASRTAEMLRRRKKLVPVISDPYNAADHERDHLR